MKHLFSILCTLAIILMSCGCDKEQDKPALPNPEILLSQQSIEVDYKSQECSIYVTSPDFWEATTECEWITIEGDTGISGTQELKFSVAFNGEVEARQGVICVQNELGTLYAELSVEQGAFLPAELSLSAVMLNYGFDGGVQEVSIACNYDYDIEVDCSWLTYQRVANGISVTVESSTISNERSAQIVVYSERYNISKTIAVVQAPFVPKLEIEKVSTLEFDYTGGTATIAIASNFEYEIVSESDWVVIERSKEGITLTIKPLYPVVNIPRSTSFIISDTLYDCGDTEITISQQCKESNFSIGEMVEFNGVKGIVFYHNADITKIVSVEQGKACWSTEYVAIDATDERNGMNNMAVVQVVDAWESKYPAFAWCANLGEGWYLPARSELYDIWEVKSELNVELVANKYPAIGVDYNYYYWSSTQSDSNNAFKLYFSTGVWDYYYKYGEYFVRAVYVF